MRRLVSLIGLLFFIVPGFATHIVGGFISYRHISGNTYEIKLTIYRDCYNSQTPFDGTPGSTTNAIVGIFNDNTGQLFQVLELQNPVITNITADNTNPCLEPPLDVCVEQGVYTSTVTLPNGTDGFTAVHERCCRNGTISNVTDPGNQGAVYSAYIPPTNTFNNTSPVFNALPPLFICRNAPLVLNYSATDADGDELHYVLCTPSSGGDVNNPAPNPPFGPPYVNIPWSPPYSLGDLLGGVPLTIDYNTGVIQGTPFDNGQYVVGVCVSEYRNGVLIATYLRDFQFNVTDCNIPVVNIPSTDIDPGTGIGTYVNTCSDFSITFKNNTYNPPPAVVPLTYHWDFGVPNLTNDTSVAQFPTYLYPDTGVYLVRLIATKSQGGISCADTTYAYVRIYPVLDANFTVADVCQNLPVAVTDISTSTYGTINNWNWTFGDGGTSTQQNPQRNYNAPGAYTITLVVGNSVGCKDTVQKSVNVFAAPNPTFTVGPTCINTPVNFTYTGGNTTVYNWSFGTGATDVVANPIYTYNNTGDYTVSIIAESANGCRDTAERLITVHSLPVVTASNDTLLCDLPASAQLFATGGATYAWSPSNGLDNPNIATPVASAVSPGVVVYNVVVTDTNLCTATESVQVSFSVGAPVNAGPDTSICLNPGSFRDSVQLTASGTVSYQWSPTTGLTAANIANPVARPLANTTYIVTGTDANGCRSYDSVIVYVLDPTLNIIVDNNKDVCIYDTVYVNAINQGASIYAWTPAQFVTDPTVYSPGFFPLSTTTFTLNVSNYCYTKADSVLIEVRPLPPLVFGGPDTICRGDSVRLSVSGAQIYVWDADDKLRGNTIQTPLVKPDSTQYFYVTGTSQYGCVNRDSTEVFVRQSPFVDAGNDTLIWRDTYATIGASTAAQKFFWSPTTFMEEPFSLTTKVHSTQTTLYVLSVEDRYGCKNADSILITVESNTVLDIPTAFSPNGDGMNDVFRIVRWLNVLKLKEFSVFNRWGNRVFSTTDIYQGWDGVYMGTEQGMGTYVWFVNVLTKDNEDIIRKGNVTLVR